jgi:hypothetical protein
LPDGAAVAALRAIDQFDWGQGWAQREEEDEDTTRGTSFSFYKYIVAVGQVKGYAQRKLQNVCFFFFA